MDYGISSLLFNTSGSVEMLSNEGQPRQIVVISLS